MSTLRVNNLANAAGTGVPSIGVPAFEAYMSGNHGLTSGGFRKMELDTESYDTSSAYDTSNYRFQPTIAGYYQLNGQAYLTNSAAFNECLVSIYKNGSRFKDGSYQNQSGAVDVMQVVSTLVYLNGSTDYVELYAYASWSSGTPNVGNSASGIRSYFNGYLVRAD